MRLLMAATLLATVFAGSSAFAQGDYAHHKWCLQKGSAQECGFDSVGAMQRFEERRHKQVRA